MSGALSKLENWLCESILLRRGREMWARNQQDWNLPLSFVDKSLIAAYLVLRDHADGRFPPSFSDQRLAYQNEMDFREVLPGMDTEAVIDAEMRKPFWPGKLGRKYLDDYLYFSSLLDRLKLGQGARLLELGCGSGWMAEFLATAGFDITATTLAPQEVEDCRKRLRSLEEKGVATRLKYMACPMESVSEHIGQEQLFDGAYVYEALHHAFSWESAIESVSDCLKEGGWLMICNEPNRMHTIRSYRGALLSNTHEIGFRKSMVINCLRDHGYRNIRVVKGKMGFYLRPFWIAAQFKREV